MIRTFFNKKVAETPLGSITVQDRTITDLTPLGSKHSPGMTKAGRLSFAGWMNGRKVKVYSAFSPRQVALSHAIRELPASGLSFPAILAHNDELVVEEWIPGQSLKQIERSRADKAPIAAAAEAVSRFLEMAQSDERFRALADEHAGAFCYIDDYLLRRVDGWRHLDAIGGFLARWQREDDRHRAAVGARLSHPDLSLANIVMEEGSGRFVVIDNELVGVGPGWVIDWHNSFLKRRSMADAPVVPEAIRPFIDLTWRLRLLGSALSTGKLHRAIEQLDAETAPSW
ncbi:phosphotransferase [Halomonas litopenaei]|uniref:phosphotransferase n=1 Tax=Halomonas litopenaei TaxID=2109328 RepID=UPI003FA136E5